MCTLSFWGRHFFFILHWLNSRICQGHKKISTVHQYELCNTTAQLFWCLLLTDNSAIVLRVSLTWKKKKTIYRLSLCIVVYSFLSKVTMLQKHLPWSNSFNLGGELWEDGKNKIFSECFDAVIRKNNKLTSFFISYTTLAESVVTCLIIQGKKQRKNATIIWNLLKGEATLAVTQNLFVQRAGDV